MGEVIERVYGPGGMPVGEASDLYGEWAGYWLLYLWASTMPGFRSP